MNTLKGAASLLVRLSAKNDSFQAKMIASSAVALMPGKESGSAMPKNSCPTVAPSTFAAS